MLQESLSSPSSFADLQLPAPVLTELSKFEHVTNSCQAILPAFLPALAGQDMILQLPREKKLFLSIVAVSKIKPGAAHLSQQFQYSFGIDAGKETGGD